MKNYKFVITVLCVILLSGCGTGKDLPSASSSASPSANIKTEKNSFQSIVENDSLLDLSPEEFAIEYAKLSDDYEIKISDKVATDILSFGVQDDEGDVEYFDFGESRIITKKQAEMINCIHPNFGGEEGLPAAYSTIPPVKVENEEYVGGAMSLKGLRYFCNVKDITFFECNLSDIEELHYLNNLEWLDFSSCDLELDETTETLRHLLISGNLTELFVNECGLTNLDFLRGISDFSGLRLEFQSNQISDITALSDLTKIYKLDLSFNQITDIMPLSNLKEVEEISLSDNQIKDITPLSNLKKAEEISLSGNQITDITALSNVTKMYGLYLSHNQIKDITPLSNLKEVKVLWLSDNPITDISPLEKLKFIDSTSYIDLENLNIDYDLAKKMFGDYIETED